MRVTTNSFNNDLRHNITKLAERQLRLQQQVSTGHRIDSASDDPNAMRRVLDLRNEQGLLRQYQDNITILRENTNMVYSTVQGFKKLSDRASEIAVVADGTKGPSALNAYAKEVDQLIEEAFRMANSKHRNVYIFSGTKGTTEAYTATRNADNQITSVTFAGNTSSAKIDIASHSTVEANYSAEGANGVLKTNVAGTDFIQNLIDLRTELSDAASATSTPADKATALSNIKDSVLSNLDLSELNFIDHFSSIGAKLSRLETSETITNQQIAAVEPLISNEIDVDLADTLVRLNEIQNAYTAALQSGSSLLRTSLLDFLQ
jgi:flagellar hook-associated protein 3 FlgL